MDRKRTNTAMTPCNHTRMICMSLHKNAMHCLALLTTSLALCACQAPASDPIGPPDVYVCPNGSVLRVSHAGNGTIIRMGMHGRVHTLTRRADNHYDNGRYLVRLDGKMLYLEMAGTLLPQHCLLQTPVKSSP